MKFIATLLAILVYAVPAFAQQTNYLGTVFIADPTTPTQQLKVNSDGSINANTGGVISSCGTAGGIGYFPTTGTTIGCSSGITASNSALTLGSGTTLTLPDASTWTSSGLSMLGTIAVTPTIVWSGSATNPPAFQPLYILETLSGTSVAPSGSILTTNGITINDNLNAGAEASIVNGFLVNDKIGASALGNRQAIEAQVNVIASPADSDAGTNFPAYVAVAANAISAYNLGGTGVTYGASGGGLYGINPNVQAQPGATNLYAVVGGEFDIQVFSGATVTQKYGITIVESAQDAVAGSYDEAAIGITNNPAAIGWSCGICFGHFDGTAWPMFPSTGSHTSLMRTYGSHTIDYGIDISPTTFRSGAFNGPVGSAAAPTFGSGGSGIYFVSTTGMCFIDINGACKGDYSITTAGTATIVGNLSVQGSQLQQVGALKFYNSGDTGVITSPTVGVINLGGGAGASPQAQTLQAQSGLGTDIAGKNFIIIGSLGTGDAASGNLYIQVGGAVAASGTTAATATTAMLIAGGTNTPEVQVNGIIATAAAPTVAGSQIGYGSTTAAVSNCGTTGPTACIVVNIAGTTHYIPYY